MARRNLTTVVKKAGRLRCLNSIGTGTILKKTVIWHRPSMYKRSKSELSTEATVKDSLTVQTEGQRQVERTVTHYNLDMILAIGYRVRSPRGTQFRRWASAILEDYLVKGFVMDDARLMPPDYDYFDELLERIRSICASEARV